MDKNPRIEVIHLNWSDSADKSWEQFKADLAGSSHDSDEALDGYQTDRGRRLAVALGIDPASWGNADSTLWQRQGAGPAQPELYILADGRWAVVQGSRAAIETEPMADLKQTAALKHKLDDGG